MTHPAGSSAERGAQRRRIRVLIVDDSALVRQMLTEILSADPALEVVGSAGDAHIARAKIKQLNPDVLTLDVEMPKMDGLTFLRNLMRLRPMPVVMVSSLTERGADVTLDALSLGAVDYLPKPRIDIAATLKDYGAELIEKVKTAAQARVRSLAPGTLGNVPPRLSADAILPRTSAGKLRTTERLIAVGASTGGTEAIKELLTQLPADTPAIVI
ncbi:MAG TPA: response regulator, partial [Steroidobacteraceae bacterium]|nr:response regulator [Steroidobacteraceae bacterium]